MKNLSITLKKYVLLYSAFLIYSISTICAKYAALQDTAIKTICYIGLEIFFLGIYALFWQQVLKLFPLVTAMANKGIVVILSLLWSVFLFQEKLTWSNIIGAFVIMAGIWMVSTDD